MIDYIGQLLEQQLEREEGEGTWETGPVRVPLPASGEENGQSGENTETDGLPGLEGRDGDALALTAGSLGTVTSGDIHRWAAGLDTLRPAGRGWADGGAETAQVLEAGAQGLDQAVRASLAALPAAEGQARVVTLEPPDRGQSGGEDALRRLDRLVRRDARRFDGGFQLL